MSLTIKSKLLGGYVIILALFIFTAFFMINKFSESNKRLSNIVDVSDKRINLSNELMIGVLKAGRHEKNIILEKDAVKLDYYKGRIYEALTSIDKRTHDLREVADENEKVMLNEFTASWNNYKTDLNEIIVLAMKNEDQKAFKISTDRGLKVRDAAMSHLRELIELNEKGVITAKVQNSESYSYAFNLVI